MFKYQKKTLLILIAFLGIFTFLEAAVPNAPGPYVGVTKLNDSNTSVRLSFEDNADNENGFYLLVYDYENSSLFKSIKINATNRVNGYANITGLTCNKIYQALAIAYNNEGNSSRSNMATFNIQTTFGATCSPIFSLNAPGPYIGITYISSSSVRISFFDNSNNEDGFKIILKDHTTGKETIIILPPNDENIKSSVYADLTGLDCSHIYSIQVKSFKNNMESELMPPRKFRIETTFGINCPPTKLEAPTFIGLTDINNSSIYVHFRDNSHNEDGFKIILKDHTNNSEKVIILPPNNEDVNTIVTKKLIGLSCTHIYSIKIVSFKDGFESKSTSSRQFRMETLFGLICPPNAPGPIGVTTLSDNSVRLSIKDNSDNEDGFRISLKDLSNGTENNITIPSNDETQHPYIYSDLMTGLTCNPHTYRIEVVAYRDGLDSLPAIKIFRTKCKIPIPSNAIE